jgi:hypothetical protein
MEQFQYPVGRYQKPTAFTEEGRASWISSLKELPVALRELEKHLTPETLAKTYRPGSWTCLQVIHHLADAHMNALMRLKFGLTQENPTVMPFDENEWAILPDYALSAGSAIAILEGVHAKLVSLIAAMTPEQFERPLYHPEFGGLRLRDIASMYAWHSRHHLAHVKMCLGLITPNLPE